MTTIINSPQPEESNQGLRTIIGSAIILLIVSLFFVYGIPAIKQIKLGGTQINLPNKIDVTVNQPN